MNADYTAEAERVAALPPRKPWPPLTDDERGQVHERLAELAEQRAGRVDAHRQRLEREARHLGREVRAYRATLTDAQTRLERLARTNDPETEIPIALVDYRDACAVVAQAFAAAWKDTP